MVESIERTCSATNGRTNLHKIKIPRLTVKSSETLIKKSNKFHCPSQYKIQNSTINIKVRKKFEF